MEFKKKLKSQLRQEKVEFVEELNDEIKRGFEQIDNVLTVSAGKIAIVEVYL